MTGCTDASQGMTTLPVTWAMQTTVTLTDCVVETTAALIGGLLPLQFVLLCAAGGLGFMSSAEEANLSQSILIANELLWTRPPSSIFNTDSQ